MVVGVGVSVSVSACYECVGQGVISSVSLPGASADHWRHCCLLTPTPTLSVLSAWAVRRWCSLTHTHTHTPVLSPSSPPPLPACLITHSHANPLQQTEPGLSVIAEAVIGARKIFQRMTTYAKYTVAMTFRICFTFGILTIAYDW